jgi:formylglycine-generating enzyme required for sulfatase activity
MARIFVSYSRKNIDFCRRLTAILQQRELDFWVDWEGIPPTVDWMQEIQKAIEEADTFIFIISPDSILSKVCKEELALAVKNGKRLIPVVASEIKWDEVPPELSHLNYIFFRESDDFDGSLTKLLTAIDTDYAWVQVHRRLQMKALDWERGNKDHGFLLRGRDLEQAEQQISINATKDPHPTEIQREYMLKSRQATDRQRRTTTGVLVFIIFMLIGISAYFATPRVMNAIKRAEAQSLEEMVRISAGRVNIGTDDPVARDTYYPESPAWFTDLPAFSIDKYEVSNRIYRLCVEFGDCTPPVRSAEYNTEQKLDHPVVSVTIVQAATYCNWVDRRLPTELEWERAARGPASADKVWPWGKDPADATRANMATESFTPTGTMPVTDLPNGRTLEGVFNLVGNVWEWTSSKQQESYENYDMNLIWDGKAKAFDQLEIFVQRGGGWNNSIERVTSRYFTYDLDAQPDAGFRCAAN